MIFTLNFVMLRCLYSCRDNSGLVDAARIFRPSRSDVGAFIAACWHKDLAKSGQFFSCSLAGLAAS